MHKSAEAFRHCFDCGTTLVDERNDDYDEVWWCDICDKGFCGSCLHYHRKDCKPKSEVDAFEPIPAEAK